MGNVKNAYISVHLKSPFRLKENQLSSEDGEEKYVSIKWSKLIREYRCIICIGQSVEFQIKSLITNFSLNERFLKGLLLSNLTKKDKEKHFFFSFLQNYDLFTHYENHFFFSYDFFQHYIHIPYKLGKPQTVILFHKHGTFLQVYTTTSDCY